VFYPVTCEHNTCEGGDYVHTCSNGRVEMKAITGTLADQVEHHADHGN